MTDGGHQQDFPPGPKAGDPASVQIEFLPDSAVIISQDYPSRLRDEHFKRTAINSGLLCSIPILIWLFFRNRPLGLIPVIISAAVVGSMVHWAFTRFAMLSRSCVLSADRYGLAVEITTRRGKTKHRFKTWEIDDVVFDGLVHVDPNYRIFNSMLVITRLNGRRIECLHNVPGDQLARVANALRAALRMPARSWP